MTTISRTPLSLVHQAWAFRKSPDQREREWVCVSRSLKHTSATISKEIEWKSVWIVIQASILAPFDQGTSVQNGLHPFMSETAAGPPFVSGVSLSSFTKVSWKSIRINTLEILYISCRTTEHHQNIDFLAFLILKFSIPCSWELNYNITNH
jgi:hypothetical protein